MKTNNHPQAENTNPQMTKAAARPLVVFLKGEKYRNLIACETENLLVKLPSTLFLLFLVQPNPPSTAAILGEQSVRIPRPYPI